MITLKQRTTTNVSSDSPRSCWWCPWCRPWWHRAAVDTRPWLRPPWRCSGRSTPAAEGWRMRSRVSCKWTHHVTTYRKVNSHSAAPNPHQPRLVVRQTNPGKCPTRGVWAELLYCLCQLWCFIRENSTNTRPNVKTDTVSGSSSITTHPHAHTGTEWFVSRNSSTSQTFLVTW